MSDTVLRATLRDVDAAIARGHVPRGHLSLARTLIHCAQSLECAVDGFPRPRGWLVRRVIGPMAARRFLRQDRLSHDLEAPIPGIEIPPVDDIAAARERLVAAIARFEALDREPAEHFAFGRLSLQDAARLQALHIRDHLTA